MESQGTARTEHCSRKPELHENLGYRHLNSVRNQNFGSKSHSGWLFLIFWQNFGSLKKSWKFQVFILVPGVRKTEFYDFSGNFTRKNREYGNLEWDDDYGISSETTIPGPRVPESFCLPPNFPLRAVPDLARSGCKSQLAILPASWITG